MSRHLRRVAPVVGVALLLAANGCTASAPGSGRPAAVVASAAAQDPVELISEARSGLDEVLAFHATGSLTLAGRKVAVDLTVAYSGGHGTFTPDGGVTVVLDYVAVNPLPGSSGLFITAPATYWTGTGASDADARQYANRQVSVPEGSGYTTLSQLLSQKGLTQLVFLTAGTVDRPHVLASPAVDGQPAWVVDFGGDHTTRLTMMQNAQQFPLRLDSPRARLTFGQFGKEPRVDSPATITLSLPG